LALSAGDTVKFPLLGLETDLLICLVNEGTFEILKVKFVMYLSLVVTGGIALNCECVCDP